MELFLCNNTDYDQIVISMFCMVLVLVSSYLASCLHQSVLVNIVKSAWELECIISTGRLQVTQEHTSVVVCLIARC